MLTSNENKEEGPPMHPLIKLADIMVRPCYFPDRFASDSDFCQFDARVRMEREMLCPDVDPSEKRQLFFLREDSP